MKGLSRREFLEGIVGTGIAVAALPLFPGLARGDAVAVGDGPDDEALRRTLARALRHGGDFADVYWERTKSQSLRLEDDRINRATVDVAMGAGVRVVKGVQTGYAFTEDLTPEAMLAAADTASLIATGANPGRIPEAFRAVEVPRRYPCATALAEVDVSKRLAIVSRANARARKADSRVRSVIVYLADDLDEVIVATSDGRMARDVRPNAGLLVNVVVEDKGLREENYFQFGGRRGIEAFTDAEVDATADEAVRRAVLMLEAVTPPAGSFPVVLGPQDCGILLHEAIGHGLEADFNRKKQSVFSDRVGQKVCSDLCTVVDDGTIEGNRGSLRFDDEGTPAERTVLIEKGVLRGYLQDRASAALMGVKSTGSGRRQSYRHPVIPRMRTTYMEAGPHSFDEIIKSIDRGIYAVSIGNGQVNIGPGDFAFYVNFGFVVEKGRLGAPIKDVNLIGNGPEVLSNVTMVAGDLGIDRGGFGYCGKDGQMVPVGFGLPHVKVSAITVGGVKV